uniref:PDZ domain-containing protein n=1 Tax=Heterorhabditis bacteriophora TaxID=37862 RepID=A0A1I7XMC5_HETBA
MSKSVSIPIALNELKKSSFRRHSSGKGRKHMSDKALSGFVILVEKAGDRVRLYGTAADRAGLEVGDEIVAVNDMEVEGKNHEEVISHIQKNLHCLQK